jgi:exopolysaccharide/PEP-CTERM locus tyrosine autokinase
MSLIEKAIEKMQQAQPGGPGRSPVSFGHAGGAQNGPFGKVVTVPRPSEPGRVVMPPSRTVEINLQALRSAGLLPPENQIRQLNRQYRQIKRPLIENAFGRGPAKLAAAQVIVVSSAIPGEGKTFTSVNLAFSMALEKDVHVVLADADIPKPHISKLLGVDKEPGLLDALQDSGRDIESMILPTSIRGLSVLPAGTKTENATELLASQRMRDIVTRMAEHDPHRIVLFDSPPLLLTTESLALTRIAGQTVVVVRADVTSQREVLDALGHLEEGRYVALVLNQSITASRSGYYYYENDGEGSDPGQSG